MQPNAARAKESFVPLRNNGCEPLLLFWTVLRGRDWLLASVIVGYGGDGKEVIGKGMPVSICDVSGSVTVFWLREGQVIPGRVWHQVHRVPQNKVRGLDCAWPLFEIVPSGCESRLGWHVVAAYVASADACRNWRLTWCVVRIAVGSCSCRRVRGCIRWWGLLLHIAL